MQPEQRRESRNLPAGTAVASLPLSASAQPGLWKAEIAQGPARTSFQFLVLGPIPGHPRLLLSPARIEELRSDSRYADLRKQVHHHAETLSAKIAFNPAAGDNIALMPSGRGIGPTEPGQLKPYIELAENYADAIAYNALDYRLNGNKAALDAARKALDAMVQLAHMGATALPAARSLYVLRGWCRRAARCVRL